jgi:hypothetical protein
MEEPQSETIQIDATTAAKLRARAEAQGLTVDELIRTLAGDTNGAKKTTLSEMTPEQRARAFEEWASSHDPKTPVILDDSRDVIYADEE